MTVAGISLLDQLCCCKFYPEVPKIFTTAEGCNLVNTVIKHEALAEQRRAPGLQFPVTR